VILKRKGVMKRDDILSAEARLIEQLRSAEQVFCAIVRKFRTIQPEGAAIR
jgi:hypothetical protein